MKTEQKASVYAELVEIAKKKGARAIITINDAIARNSLRFDADFHGKVTPKQTQECIYLGTRYADLDYLLAVRAEWK